MIRTEALDARIASLAEQEGSEPGLVLQRAVAAAGILLVRAGSADEVAQVIMSLVSPAASSARLDGYVRCVRGHVPQVGGIRRSAEPDRDAIPAPPPVS